VLAGFLVGLVTGLVLAVLVAVFVTRAPIPFVDRGARSPGHVFEPKSLADAPDPNRSLNERGFSVPSGAGDVVPPAGSGAPSAVLPGIVPGQRDAAAGSAAVAGAQQYLLQAGAFRSSPEAENMKVRLALIGFEAQVSDVRVDGRTLYRVRIGPYAQPDAMNRARARLAENGIEVSVVRQP
jgi:hypothetical protein